MFALLFSLCLVFSRSLSVNTVARYLDILQQMRLVTRRVPATETQPEKSKKGLYQIDDHFLRFWFRYVHPNLGGLDLGLADAILEQRIQPNLEQFVAYPFEEAAQAFIAQQARAGQLAFLPERVGGWWDREAEIDVLAISFAEQTALVGECKWSIHAVGTNVLEDLQHKAGILARESKLVPDRIQYALFSRSGFTPALLEQAKVESISLYTIDQMMTQIR